MGVSLEWRKCVESYEWACNPRVGMNNFSSDISINIELSLMVHRIYLLVMCNEMLFINMDIDD